MAREGMHYKTVILDGDSHDRLLRELLGGANWRDVDPAFCRRAEIAAPHLLRIADSLSLATDIWVCRQFLAGRWPGWTIQNRMVRVGRKNHSTYQIMTLEDAEVLERAAADRRQGRSVKAASGSPGSGQGVSGCVPGHKAPAAPGPGVRECAEPLGIGVIIRDISDRFCGGGK